MTAAPAQPLRLVAWNIRQGGGANTQRYASLMTDWAPDLCILSEYGATPSSEAIRRHLADLGLTHSRSTVGPADDPELYGLLVASRWPLTPLGLEIDGMPAQRWCGVRVERPAPLLLGAVHVPRRDELGGVKYRCLDSIVALARAQGAAPMVIAGAFNSGRMGLDEEGRSFDQREDGFMRAMARESWASAFRLAHGNVRHYSYRDARSGNHLLIDHAFVSPPLVPKVADCALVRQPEPWPSDHAALLLDLSY